MTRQISEIDRDITTIHKELRRLEKIKPFDAASWQAAWDKHPDLWERERALYRERGAAQKVRDDAAYRLAMAGKRSAAARRTRMKKCPTCGSRVAPESIRVAS